MEQTRFDIQFSALRSAIIEREFSELNDRQREAVFHTEGPLLVLAGAGSGKTTVLIHRIINILRFGRGYSCPYAPDDATEEDLLFLREYLRTPTEKNRLRAETLCAVEPARPWQILAITFTNKAAKEIQSRLQRALGEDFARDIWASTFHSMCMRILRRECEAIGYDRSFTIYDTDDQKRVLTAVIKGRRLDDKVFDVRTVAAAIGRAKDNLMTPRMLLQEAQDRYYETTIAEIYKEYARQLRESNAMDFDDLIMKTVQLFQGNPEILERYQRQFHYVLADEYQDTNHAQYVLTSLLAGGYENICVVGDDDQSIYKFRGATITNILEFEQQYPNAVTIRLEQNYRSTQNILSAANELIRNNANRKGKELWTDNGDGTKIRFHRSDTQEGEAEYIAQSILEGFAEGNRWSDYAILYRNHVLSNALESAFKRNSVPYRIVSGLRFFDRAEVRDMLAYLWVILNPADDLRLRRIINVPARKIGNKTVETVADLASRGNTTMFDIISRAGEYDELGRAAAALKKFALMIDDLQKMLEYLPLDEFYEQVMEHTGYLAALEAKGEAEQARIENTMELKSNIAEYAQREENPTLAGFMEEVSLFTDIDRMDADADAVVMMTMHSAKGLEFPNVFLIGMEDGIFPSFRSTENEEDLEEERRLCYVAVTRAKKQLYLTCAERRMMYGRTQYSKPSRFLEEIPEKFVDSNISETQRERQQRLDMRPSAGHQTKRAFEISGGFRKKQTTAKPKIAAMDLKPGDQVDHKAFGHGMITSCMPMGGDILLEITFDQVGTKRLMAKSAMKFMVKK